MTVIVLPFFTGSGEASVVRVALRWRWVLPRPPCQVIPSLALTARAPSFQVPASLLNRSMLASEDLGRNWIFAEHLRTVWEDTVQVPGPSPASRSSEFSPRVAPR